MAEDWVRSKPSPRWFVAVRVLIGTAIRWPPRGPSSIGCGIGDGSRQELHRGVGFKRGRRTGIGLTGCDQCQPTLRFLANPGEVGLPKVGGISGMADNTGLTLLGNKCAMGIGCKPADRF